MNTNEKRVLMASAIKTLYRYYMKKSKQPIVAQGLHEALTHKNYPPYINMGELIDKWESIHLKKC